MMHIPSMKEITKRRNIGTIKEPDLLLVPLLERFGVRPQPTVGIGDKVGKYQVIGQASEGFSGKVHSPVSGTVENMGQVEQLDGTMSLTVFIRNDHKCSEISLSSSKGDEMLPEDILKKIEDAGIVGLGGAQFPTAMKYNRKGRRVDTFIINGAECEPYLTSDYTLMSQHTEELFQGIILADRVLEAGQIVIAVENSNRELEKVMRPFLDKYEKIRLQVVPDQYPQGGELQLAKTIGKVEIPKGMVPIEKGVVVSNVGTVIAIYDAVVNGRPLIERVITVSGEMVQNPGSYCVLVGTPISHIIEHFGIDMGEGVVVAGGPMMSPQVTNPDAPIHKGTLGIIALGKKQIDRMNCIWCGYCADVCPMKLMPMKYDELYRKGKIARMANYNLTDCIECAACEYICPSNVPLIRSIKEGKAKLKTLKDAAR